MKLKITLIAVLLLNLFCGQAQVTPTLFHNNLSNGVQFADGMDMEIYNNELYISITSAGKIVKVSLSAPNSPVVDVVTGLTYPTGLKVVGNELYFLQRNNAVIAPGSGKLSKINASLANPTVVDLYSGLMYPIEIDANGTNVYVSEAFIDSNEDLINMQISLINLSGAPIKTVLNNQFYSIDDFEFKDNFLYVTEWSGAEVNGATNILKLDVTTGTPTAAIAYYNDAPGDFFYKGEIYNNYIYLNRDSSPQVIKRIDLNSATPTASLAVSGFDFNGNNPDIGEMIADGNNNLYFFGDYYNGTTTTYLLYKANLNSLATQDFEKSPKVALYPNPTSDFISFSNLEDSSEYQIISIDGKVVKTGNTNADEKINISHFTTGVYTARLGYKSFKFVKK
ncbi:T9SS type A sorting domain-containing protein [Flavobacterium sp. DGU38]|uniref:T9SS type A sorting domain-containing protein n=1 Tax=Flavobacterium calami TaxID=3139144 RepID=A0ABU9ISS2_9FLAO